MTTLYKHRIYCLHGTAGPITADVASDATTFAVDAAVLADVTIAAGSLIWLDDGTNKSEAMTILSVDSGAGTLTVDVEPGTAFAAATPTNVVRVPHWAHLWTETSTELVVCPEDAGHPVNPNSASTVEIKLPNEVVIQQSSVNYKTPLLVGQVLTVAAGETGTADFVWKIPITVKNVKGIFTQSNTGDTFDFVTNPDYTVGLLSAGVGIGDTVLPVTQTVLNYVKPGFTITLTEGVTSNVLDEIISIDANAMTITVATPTTDAFSVLALVSSTIYNTKGTPVPYTTKGDTMKLETGKDLISGSTIFAGVKLRIIYHNAGPGISITHIYVSSLSE